MITFTDKFRPYNTYYNAGLITNYIEEAAWLGGWARRQPITLTGAASGAQTDYQLFLNVPHTSGMKDNFEDLRFTKGDGVSLIDHWIEESEPTISGSIYVEFPTTPTNTATETYYMYYDNNAAPDASDAANTMLQYHGAATTPFLDPLVLPYSDIAFKAMVANTSVGNHNCRWGLSNHIDGTDDMVMINSQSSTHRRRHYTGNDGVISTLWEYGDFNTDQPYIIEITITEGVTKATVDGNPIQNSVGMSTNLPNEPLGLWMSADLGTQNQTLSHARKFVNNPATYAFGVEETE